MAERRGIQHHHHLTTALSSISLKFSLFLGAKGELKGEALFLEA